MPTNALEIILPLCYLVATCRILFGYTLNKIKQKTGIKTNNARKLMKCVIK